MNRHYTLLELSQTPTLPELKAAYHRLAKRNHPDLFPDDQKPRQQLAMMRINEAYMSVMADVVGGVGGGDAGRGSVAPRTKAPGTTPRGTAARNGFAAGTSTADAAAAGEWSDSRMRPSFSAGYSAGRADAGSRTHTQTREEAKTRTRVRGQTPSSQATAEPSVPPGAVGLPRDPAYSYYKAGFRYYHLGATELLRRDSHKIRRYLITTGTADGYILRLAIRALHYFERAYSYFLVVADQYGDSPWSHDARYKLHRLEKFSAIYQRICENLSRHSSSNRAASSTLHGAEPS